MLGTTTIRGALERPSPNIESCLDYYMHHHFEAGKSVTSSVFGDCAYIDLLRRGTRFQPSGKNRGLPRKLFPHRVRKADIFYIGEPHGFLETSAGISEAIEVMSDNAVLVLPSLDVHSNFTYFEFLKEETEFNLHFVMENTAFFGFERISSTEREGWWSEGLNVQRFPAYDHLAYSVSPKLPICFDYTGYTQKIGKEFVSGFMVRSGRILSNGHKSMMTFSVSPPASRRVSVELEFRGIGVSNRHGAAVEVLIGDVDPTVVQLTSGEATKVSATIEVAETGLIPVLLRHRNLKDGSSIDEKLITLNKWSLPNIEFLSAAFREEATSTPTNLVVRSSGTIASFEYANQSFNFLVNNPHDSIQAHHFVGEFYEIEELELISKHTTEGMRFLDVGANIGNHAVYFEKILRASRVLTIELQTQVISLLRLNAVLNGLKVTDLSKLGIGFGADDHLAQISVPQAFNVAGAQFSADTDGEYVIRTGDSVLPNDDFDFVKVDVEGMECDVIEGLSKLIGRCKPLLFVEVWNENRDRFDAQMSALGYRVKAEYRRYDVATNLLLEAVNDG